MAAISARELVNEVLQAIEESGYSAAYLSATLRDHPRRFAISLPQGGYLSAWVYVWTLTHGGRPNLPNEYRIQMTTVSSPLGVNPSGPTALLGFEPDLRLFAGFDLARHQEFTSGSPSVQVNFEVVRQALQQGLSFDRKTNDEIAIGIRPDHLVDYIVCAADLHRYGRYPDTFGLLSRVVSMQEVLTNEFAALPTPRRRIVETISRLSRLGNFRQQVLHAYGSRCAVSRMQLRLVDAAHILPVGAPESSDDVRNGLALSPTYHRAYDAGLIYLDDTFLMKINPAKISDLRLLRLVGGLQSFQSPLGRIHLPPDRQQWPNTDFIRLANRYRSIA